MSEHPRFELGEMEQLEIRKDALVKFLHSILNKDEIPFFISDVASVYDVTLMDDEEVFARVKECYGVGLETKDLLQPLWQLLDKLSQAKLD